MKMKNKINKKNKLFVWVENYVNYKYYLKGWMLFFFRFTLKSKIANLYKKIFKLEKIEKNSFKLNKGVKLLLRFILNERYIYIRLILIIYIIYILYDPNFFLRYSISLIILIIILRYKLIYYYLNLDNSQKLLKEIFNKYKIINMVGKIVYFLINPVLCWHIFSRVWLEIIKIIRYIMIVLKIDKYWYYIDILLNYIINIYLKLWVIQLLVIIKKIKEKIVKNDLKKIINWRLTVIIINILIIQKILLLLNFKMPWILIIFILYNIYIIEQSLEYIVSRQNTNNSHYYLNKISFYENYRSIVNVREINKLSVIFKNLKFNKEKKIDKLIIYFFVETVRAYYHVSFYKDDILYPYWVNSRLYYAEIYKNLVSIKELNLFILELQHVIILYYKWKWLYEVLYLKKYNKKIKNISEIYYNEKNRKVQNKNLMKWEYENIKKTYDINTVKICLNIYEKLIKLYKEYLEILDKNYEKTNQTLEVEISVYLDFTNFAKWSQYRDNTFDDIGYTEHIYLNYYLNNDNYKIYNNKQAKYELNSIINQIDYLYTEIKLQNEIEHRRLGYAISIIDLETGIITWYKKDEYPKDIFYKSVNIDFIYKGLNNLLKNNKQIKLKNKIKINKYK